MSNLRTFPGGEDYRDHSAYERLIGVHRGIAELEDVIFEHLPADLAMAWPERLIAAIPVGVDLAPAFHRFMAWLADCATVYADDDGKRVNAMVSALHLRAAAGNMPKKKEWVAAWNAAWEAVGSAGRSFTNARTFDAALCAAVEAATSAAESASRSAADRAARSAAWAAAWAAAFEAAKSGAESAARSAAWSAAYVAMADRLVALIEESGRTGGRS